MRFLLPLLLILTACSQVQHKDKPQELPRQTVILAPAAQNEMHVLTVQMATTEEQREKGLMFVKSMPQSEGMLFVFPTTEPRSFWMRNTFIPLDLIYLKDNKVVNIIPWAKPHDESPLPSAGPVNMVLEVNGGWAASNNISTGSTLSFSN